MNSAQALDFVKEQGVVLASAKGPVPRLAEVIAGEPIKGSWWGHPDSHRIFAVLQALGASSDILVCRLIDGKVTLVHRRLWPALARLADEIGPDRLAQVHEEHTSQGHHLSRDVPFPHWAPPELLEKARALSAADAKKVLGSLASLLCPGAPSPRAGRKRTR
ncbi:MAG: hypothetical protein ABSF50_15480 [Burkholderiaceae bacterium]